ncbi:hypothetical protein [Pseudomonas sp. LP_7_YM]|uniref:hypothetical protein n=1 Tax=Pseudomonas sp. LP_7_YM TaxID=2485137 RepID=UPI00105C4E8C|nr:hypothetical protein [Pseudomonas sp. LP_7_YM]TDV72155.1 hypothetical protein EC915_101295 [Pseudomonas sp. LP_7_YM]
MDEIHRLSELLIANQRYEEQKHQRFHDDLAQWNASIDALYEQVEIWLKPLVDAGQTAFEYEPHLAQSKGYPDENSPFRTRRMGFYVGAHTVSFVPDAMGAKGQVSISVSGLSLHGQEKYSLHLDAGSRDWMLKKTVGVKDAEPLAFTADYFGKLLQGVVPQRQV